MHDPSSPAPRKQGSAYPLSSGVLSSLAWAFFLPAVEEKRNSRWYGNANKYMQFNRKPITKDRTCPHMESTNDPMLTLFPVEALRQPSGNKL